jgi:hypothetical protein
MFSTRSKSQNRVKISNFLTILGITRKAIIIEEWTKNLKDLVLSYGYNKIKLQNKCATARQSLLIGPLMTWGGEGPYCSVYTYCAAISGKCWLKTLRPDNSKKTPHNSPDFWQQALVHKGLIEYDLKFRKIVRCWQKQRYENSNLKEKKILNCLFSSKAFVKNFFFLFLVWICLKFTAKNKNVDNFFKHTENGGVRRNG